MKILSFGAGMQSTALALMACENAMNDPAPVSYTHLTLPTIA